MFNPLRILANATTRRENAELRDRCRRQTVAIAEQMVEIAQLQHANADLIRENRQARREMGEAAISGHAWNGMI